jgi:lantibiotic protection ABC transporter MutE/EpiE family permease subunit
MYSYFKSEELKMKHTFARKLIFLAPIFTILLSLVLAPMYFQIDCYNWWYAMILPGSISLGCTLVAAKDKKMKNRAVLSLPINLRKVWISKVLVCTAMLIGASMILFLGSSVLGGILNLNEIIKVPIFNKLVAVLILVITFLWQIPLCLFLGSKIGMFPTILINIIAYMVLGILAATKSIWWMIPYAIPARLMCPILKVLPNGLPAVEGSMTFKPELLSNSVILPGVIITAILFIILTMVTAKWYEGQEAK